jgi:hypothetical protein
MFTRFVISASLVFCQGIAMAQGAGDFTGTWKGNLTAKNGRAYAVVMAISGDTGTFHRTTGGKEDVCARKDFPVQLSVQSNSEANFQINGSKVILGCPDGVGTLKLVSPKAMEATFSTGGVMALTRD